MTQRQVSLSSKTLSEAIKDRDVERPALMRWNDWQQWRRDVGSRPTAAVDGEATTSAQESALWKSIMLELYGTEWPLMLASNLDNPPAPPLSLATATPQLGEPSLEPAANAESSQRSAPSLEPVAGAGQATEVVTPRQAPAVHVSPGSGDLLAAAPGSGPAMPVPSWSSQNPGTPSGKIPN